jgi:outer membrane protein, heavy metal efflux system
VLVELEAWRSSPNRYKRALPTRQFYSFLDTVRTTRGQGWDYADEADGLTSVAVGQNSARLSRLSHALVSAFDSTERLQVSSMKRTTKIIRCWLTAIVLMTCCLGCQTSKRQQLHNAQPLTQMSTGPSQSSDPQAPALKVQLASHPQLDEIAQPLPVPEALKADVVVAEEQSSAVESLSALEAEAVANNPTLRRMQHEAAAERSKTGYISKLPDPTVSSMFFTPPMNFEPDRQVAEAQVMQMIPWLGRLKAEAQRAHLEALVAQTQYQAERLRVIGDIRANWFKLYVLGKQIETTTAEQEQLESLITTANARIRTGDAQPGDVLMATLELSSLQEQLLADRQQVAATAAELNRLVGRPANTPIEPPTMIEADLPEWNHELLKQIALETQPELKVARLRTAATRWGIEVVRLKRRPDISLGLGWVFMDAPGALQPDAGRDSLTLGASASIPVSRRKYDAMSAEASSEYHAAHAAEDEIVLSLDAQLLDLWEQALAKQQTVELYEQSILPQARQTFEADQKSLINNTVSFDRVVRDYRTLLNLELGYHKALGELATTLARIRYTVGTDLLTAPEQLPER